MDAHVLYAQSLIKEADKHYKVSYWTADDGLPGNACVKIFQDVDGFLWIGGFDGLVRFDGSRFTTYSKNNNQLSNFALAVVGDKAGNVWIGTDRGIFHYAKGKITDLADKDHNFYIESLFLDETQHRLWIGSRNAGLYTYDLTTRQYAFVDGPKNDDIINDIVKDKDESIWVGSEKNGLMHFKDGKWTTYTEKDGLLSTEIETLNLTDGVLYVGTTSGLYIFRPGEKISQLEKFRNVRINKVIHDKNKKLWVGTVNGLYHQVDEETWRFFSRADGLSNNDIRDIFVDEDGSIWLGTYRGGVNQLRETIFATYFTREDQRIEAAGALCQLNEGTLLVGSTEGKLFTIKDGIVNDYKIKTPIRQRIYNILKDRKKNIWVASYDGLLLITPDGHEKLFTEKDGILTKQVRIIFQDRKNNFWIGTRNAGLIKMTVDRNPEAPRFRQYMQSALSRVNSTFIMDLNEDSKGNLLICTNNGGITMISPDSTLTNYNKKNSALASNTCFAVHEDKQGVIWITTTDGLTRIKNGNLFTFTRKVGMPHENPMDVIEDNLGFFWLPTQKGTIRVNKQQLNDFVDHKITSIEWKLFDKNNDLDKSECTGTAHGLKSIDGTVWLAMVGGLISVNPSTIQISKREPRIYIERVTVDDQVIDTDKPIVVESTSHRVAFDYLALTLLYPNSARYKYRLIDFDKAWIDAGANRQAVYTNLPHGQYSFSVMAANNDGVWSTINTNVSIVVEPRFYQTWWFITFSSLGLLSIVGIYTRVRTNSIKERSVYLEQLVKERTKLIVKQRDELVTLNQDLRSSQDEVLSQRDSLAEKIRELADKNEEIENINANLEKIVEMRTKTLEDQNKRIAEYSFINAHNLRGPLASILGLINLINQESDHENRLKLNHHLLKSAEALDAVVRSINRMLEKEFKDDINLSNKSEQREEIRSEHKQESNSNA